MKKLFVTLIMMTLTMSTFAYDFSAVCESGQTLYYNILDETEKTVEITYAEYYHAGHEQWYTYYYGVTPPMGDLVIPEHVLYNGVEYTVIRVGDNAFNICDLTSVIFPNSIISIGARAFASDSWLSLVGELILPDNLQSIGFRAFEWNTALTAVYIPNSVKSIGMWCFYTCVGLKFLSLGSGLEEISYEAFSNCYSLDSITIHCPTPPICQYSSFRVVPKDIPVFVPFGTKERYEQAEFWNEFTNFVETYEIALGSEWYYEIINDDGTVTYQHLEYTADTTINNERPKIIVRSNTQYDRDTIFTEVTHEYILEESNKVYWWNKDLEEFTVLYDLAAETGDEWEIKVGTESIIVHVDSVGVFEYQGDTRKILHISDVGNIFNGDIVVGYGHMTSFFPEKLMNRNANFTVDGLRCYWVGDALLYHNSEEDCDAIYSQIHGVEEDGPSTGSGALVVYPNPANDILFVQTLRATSLPAEQKYRITNLMGQTVLSGNITAENQQINIKRLPAGMYFITIGNATQKFVVK
jgi:hypothetical protein